MKKFIEEFKAFALRGNMMDMAVGVIIGGAFTGIVTSLTENFINPILSFVTGAETYGLKDIAKFASNFVSEFVNFLILAFVLFCLLKGINKLMSLGHKKKSRPLPPQNSVRSASARFLLRQHAARTVHLYLKKKFSKKANKTYIKGPLFPEYSGNRGPFY